MTIKRYEAFEGYEWNASHPERRIADEYDIVVGPDEFEAVLTEPEDRRCARDIRPLIARLNKQLTDHAAELERVKADAFRRGQESMRERACQEAYGSTDHFIVDVIRSLPLKTEGM